MEYVFGTKDEIEILKTKGDAHTDLTGYIQTVREFPGEKITDNFRIVRKISSSEDSEGTQSYHTYIKLPVMEDKP